jgi:hypothetical protein
MADNNDRQNHDSPKPDPALKRLNRLVGSWTMKGRPVGSDEDSITGRTTFKWLHGTTFHGKFSPDGNRFSGGWRPNPGADEAINAPYDITVSRVEE